MNRTHVIGRLVLTSTRQAAGAPILDGGMIVCDEQGWRAGSVVIRHSRQPGRALVIGWKGSVSGWPSLRQMQRRHPHAARVLRPLLTPRFNV